MISAHKWVQWFIGFNSKPSLACDGQDIEAQASKDARGWTLRQQVQSASTASHMEQKGCSAGRDIL